MNVKNAASVIGVLCTVLFWMASAQGQTSDGPALCAEQEGIVLVAAHTATGDLDKLRTAMNESLDAGLTINEIREVLIQMYAYSGFPRSLRGINTLMDVLDKREERGIEDETGPEATPLPEDRDRYQAGLDVLETLTGEPQDGPKEGYSAFSPTIDRFLKEHLFADIFGRDVLDYSQRELATIAALTSMRGLEPMLESHMEVGLNVGVTEAQLEQILSLVETEVSKQQAQAGRQVLARVLGEEPGEHAGQDQKERASTRLFPSGEPITNDHFTGNVWLEMLVTDSETYDMRMGNVTFEPGARTDWHAHPGGQILIGTRGTGRYQEKDGAIETIELGEVVRIAPSVVHWHGASPESEFTHIAIVPNSEKGPTEWLDAVSDEAYRGSK